MTVSELYELKRKFLKSPPKVTPEQHSGYVIMELFVDYLANWIYKKDFNDS